MQSAALPGVDPDELYDVAAGPLHCLSQDNRRLKLNHGDDRNLAAMAKRYLKITPRHHQRGGAHHHQKGTDDNAEGQ